MAVTASIPTVLDTLREQLMARPGMADVLVHTAAIGDPRGKDSLQIYQAETDNEFRALGNRRIDEDYTITGAIWVYRRGIDSEDAITNARDGCFAVFDELLEQLRSDPRINNTVVQAEVESYLFEQGYTSEQRVATIEVRIRVQNKITA